MLDFLLNTVERIQANTDISYLQDTGLQLQVSYPPELQLPRRRFSSQSEEKCITFLLLRSYSFLHTALKRAIFQISLKTVSAFSSLNLVKHRNYRIKFAWKIKYKIPINFVGELTWFQAIISRRIVFLINTIKR